ncbi:expressed unknown protein [Seminavis robusta]|uniref:Uncharacterized protein n=1 Tax=Seminavis robusta TaxID=568900 RepID=A0A9N8HG81_9STRA|nr:expressed unknown protein [Seminavis robusta]|eukprot:Sro562_g167070.1 n/a (261) ;mRNA; f:36985-37767
MVIQGRFKLELVTAENTDHPFKEHSRNGKHYAEVEPEAEYFIRVQVLEEGEFPVIATFEVDGVDLGYHGRFFQTSSSLKGAWQYKNGTSAHSALRFEKPRFSANNDPQQPAKPPSAMMGTVSVYFYRAVFSHKRKRPDHDRKEISNAAESASSGKETIRSGQGSTLRTQSNVSIEEDVYHKGDLLETLTLNYCTAVGLVNAGVLCGWEHARTVAPFSEPTDPQLANIKPKVIERDAVVEDGVTIKKAERIEVYDLSSLDD